MFEVGWTEILVISIVALIVFPTKDLPRLLRTVGQLVGKARRMAGDMQAQFSQALREAEREADLSDIKTSVQNANPLTDLKKTFDPVRNFGDDLKKSVTTPIPPKAADPAVPAETPIPVEAEPRGEAAIEPSAPPTPPSAGAESSSEAATSRSPATTSKDGSAE